jgi:hypothetical protein
MNFDTAQLHMSVTNTTVYEYAILARGDGASEARIVDGTGTNTDFDHQTVSTDWVLYTGTFTANATGTLNVLTFYCDGNNSATGYAEYIVSIKEQ